MTTGPGSPVPESFGAPPPLTVGARLGDRYELLHEIASGGMATVWLARARAEGVQNFERIVAIKVCHPHLRHEEEFTSMFLDEARMAARIHHPNVVSTIDVNEGTYLYLVMEYIEGDRISGLIKAAAKRGERLPVPITLRIMIDVLNGLHAAHELRDHQDKPYHIVHRDVSPQNILVGVDGVSRITDFGIAKAEARLTHTREGQVKGKMSYMAPEQLQSHEVDRRADVYAAGVVLWEALTGRRLFRANSDAETLHLVLNADVPAPSTVVPGFAPAPQPAPDEEATSQLAKKLPAPPAPPPCITPALDAVVMKALERDPNKRYATAEEFAEALENLADVKVASTRAVAAYINELLADMIARRRELVRRLSEAGPMAIEHSGVRAALGNAFEQRATMTGLPTFRPSVPPLLPVASTSGARAMPTDAEQTASIEVNPEPARTSRRTVWAAVGALTLLALVGAVGVLHRSPATPSATRRIVAHSTPTTAQPEVPPTFPAAAPVNPAPANPAPANPAPANPAPELPTAVGVLVTATPSGSTVVPARPARVGSQTRPARPARPARPSGSEPTPPTTNPPPQGSSEFRPSGI
jgi:serine/threonine-protein kinase